MRKIILALTFIYLFPTISISQPQDIKSEYQICIKALDFIKDKNTDGLKTLIHEDAFKNTSVEQFTKAVNDIYKITNGEKNPTIDMIVVTTSFSDWSGQNTKVYSLGFPFPPKSKRKDMGGISVFFMFSKEIKENKIVGWKVRDFEAPLVRQEEEDKKLLQSVHKFDFNTKNINWFRIVYKKTTSIDNHFTISGDSVTLRKANIKDKLDEIFSMLNESKIEKRDYKVESLSAHPNLELHVLQFVFSNYDPKLYREFEIAIMLSEDPQIKEEYGEYVIVKHGRKYRHFISTKDNPTIVTKIKELTKMIF